MADETTKPKPLVGKITFPLSVETPLPEFAQISSGPKQAEEWDDDTIDGPTHYNGYEVLECINNSGVGFEIGNVVKYCLRSKKKGKELRDLQKAQFYLNWYIDRLEGK